MSFRQQHRRFCPRVTGMIAFLLASSAEAQQNPRAPLAPGADSRIEARRMAPIAPAVGMQVPAMAPSAPAANFQASLGNLLDRAALIEMGPNEVQLVNTTNGIFSVRYGEGASAKTLSIEPYRIAHLPCDPCDRPVRIDFHDGVDAKFVSQPLGKRGYIIIHPLYQRFEIIDQLQADRLAGRSR